MSNNKNLFDDIYSISLRKLRQSEDKNYDLTKVEKVVELSLEFFGISKSVFSDFDMCCQKLLQNARILINKPSLLSDDDDHVDWYDSNNERPFWETHRTWLLEEVKHPISVVNSIDRTTDEIISKLENPAREGRWDRKGLVVGSVQSGKTEHFISLANKAVDAGYKRIIVLSGLTNDLRRQSHFRLDEGFFGFNTEFLGEDRSNLRFVDHRMALKLGEIRGAKFVRPITLTNSGMKGDLSTAVIRQANVLTDHPILLCIKKNKTSLQNLIKLFLSSPETANKASFEQSPFRIVSDINPPYLESSPIFVIDDEVDHASVDTGNQPYDVDDQPDEEYNPKTINRLIRQLLHIHAKKAYVGYTATPISNIFIHEKGFTKIYGPDIFPKSFIYDLPVPSNYFGIEKMFTEDEDGTIDETFIKLLYDHCSDPNDLLCNVGWIPPKHKKEHLPVSENGDAVPDSLREAIFSFLVSCALRNLRGQYNQHKSMLIHVSKYVFVNEQIFRQVVAEMDEIRSILKNPGEPFHKIAIYKFKLLYDELRRKGMDKEISFEELIKEEKGLIYVAQDVSKNIKNLSGKSVDVLDYDRFEALNKRGINTIVIGGDRLSRGITLEGLTTSYFLRSSRMYDTLMQMGRWFGYRDGYEDLTRLYTTSDLAEWFEYISKAMAELRIQFRVMANYGATPINFGLKVKSHPLLMVTSNVKMRHGHELETNFVDHFSQMVTFDLKTIKENLGLTNEFLSSMKEPDERDLIVRKNLFNERNSFVWRDIESTKVISFLSKFKTHEDAKSVKPYLYSEFIKNMNNSGELMNWTIGLMGAGRSKYLFRIADKYQVELAIRKPRKNSNEKKFSIGVLTDPKHEGLDLSAEQIKEALSKSGGLKNLGANFRQQRDRKNGLLLLYPVLTCYSDSDYNDAKKAKEKSDYQGIPSVGFAVSFPSNSKVSPENMNVRYVVNNIYHKEEFQSSSS